MEKKNAHAMILAIFVVGLITAAILWDNPQSAELGMLQTSMRELKRVDNLEYSYVTTVRSAGTVTGDEITVWSDQLSGCWISEHYKIDEDGRRLYLKQFCDGVRVYNYIEWTGEWELQSTKSVDAPYMDQILSIPYEDEDILELTRIEDEAGQTLSFVFTPEYIDEQNESRKDTVEKAYQDYMKMAGEEAQTNEMVMTMEQYMRTRQKDIAVTYQINAEGVLMGMQCTMTVIQPELIYNTNEELMIGKERESGYEIVVTVNRYNQQGTLNKLEQCKNEILYQ